MDLPPFRNRVLPPLRSWVAPFVIVLGAVVSAALGKPAYKLYTGEDGIVEVLQVLFVGLAIFYCFRAWRRIRGVHSQIISAPFLVAALGLFFLLGEEISWGQRIFGWATPEDLVRLNRQEETNLHNLEGVHQTVRWVQLLVGAYGTFLPIWFRHGGWLARWRAWFGLYVPLVTHIPYFFPLFLWRIYKNLLPTPEAQAFAIDQFNEVPELILAIGFFLFFRHRSLLASSRSERLSTAPAR